MRMHKTLAAGVAMAIGLACLVGCLKSGEEAATSGTGGSSGWFAARTLPTGTSFAVRLTSSLSSETARVGDSGTGLVVNPVNIGSRDVVSAGSYAHGVVTASLE